MIVYRGTAAQTVAALLQVIRIVVVVIGFLIGIPRLMSGTEHRSVTSQCDKRLFMRGFFTIPSLFYTKISERIARKRITFNISILL